MFGLADRLPIDGFTFYDIATDWILDAFRAFILSLNDSGYYWYAND
jgi:hypothetical protein